MIVESIVDVGIGRETSGDRVPAAHIHAPIPCAMVDTKSQEIRIRPSPHEGSGQICAPPLSQVAEHKIPRMLRSPEQRLPRKKERITKGFWCAKRRLDDP